MKGLAVLLDQFEKCSETALKGVLMTSCKIVVDCFQAIDFMTKYENQYDVIQVKKTFQMNLPIYAAIMSKPFLRWLSIEVQHSGSLVVTHAELNQSEIDLINAYNPGLYDNFLAKSNAGQLLSEDVKVELFIAKIQASLVPYDYSLISKVDEIPQAELEQASEPIDKETNELEIPESIQGLHEQLTFIYNQCAQKEEAIRKLLKASLKANEITKEQYELLKSTNSFKFLN